MNENDTPYTFWTILALFSAILLFILLSSCKSTERLVVESVHDTTYISSTKRDSIYFRDSIFTERWMQGDTCYIYKFKETVRWRDILLRDTVYRSSNDTVTIQEPPIYIEKKLTWWQELCNATGEIFIYLVLTIGAGYFILRLFLIK